MGQKFGFNPEFNSWVKLLPSPQSTQMDSILSQFSFIVEPNRATPPSLSFSIAAEPLAIRLHPEGGIEGIARAGKVSTLSLYANDLWSNSPWFFPWFLLSHVGPIQAIKAINTKPYVSFQKYTPLLFPSQICYRWIYIFGGVYSKFHQSMESAFPKRGVNSVLTEGPTVLFV